MMFRANSTVWCYFGHELYFYSRTQCGKFVVDFGGVFSGLLLSLLLFGACSCLLTPVGAFEYEDVPPTIQEQNFNPSENINEQTINGNGERIYPNQTTNPNIGSLDPSNDDDNEKNPREVQKAVCTITAGEVKASAEAVTTKTLKGVCGSAELQLAVSNLEAKIFKELESIKTLLQQLINNKDPTMTATTTQTHCDCNNNINHSNTLPLPSVPFESVTKKLVPVHPNTLKSPKLKSLSTSQYAVRSREKEVSTFNNTMLADKDFKVFTYYWRLENFTARIENGISLTLDSPRFTIKGKPLQLKAYFHHLHRDFLYLQLEYATTTTTGNGNMRNSNSISLDMGLTGGGTLFRAISSNDQILFKYKITILDQQNLRSSKDLVSQEFHNLEGGFLVPNSALLGSSYIKNDTLLIQLFLYL